MWGGADKKDALDAIHTAVDLGITTIDTAPVYGLGLSEEIVGDAVSGIPRDRIQLLTKFGLRWDTKQGEFYFHTNDNDGNPIDLYKYSGSDSVIYECEQSLKRLKTGALVGARNKKQVTENAKAGDISLSSYEIEQINAWLDELEFDV
jgi:aryl-alcohol dehydrogenase-like predicted oxidoreductase